MLSFLQRLKGIVFYFCGNENIVIVLSFYSESLAIRQYVRKKDRFLSGVQRKRKGVERCRGSRKQLMWLRFLWLFPSLSMQLNDIDCLAPWTRISRKLTSEIPDVLNFPSATHQLRASKNAPSPGFTLKLLQSPTLLTPFPPFWNQ